LYPNYSIIIFLGHETTVIEGTECYCEKCQRDNGNSFHLLVSGIPTTSITTAIISAIITAVIMRMFFEMKCRKRKRNNSFSPQISTTSQENPIPISTGPVYDEVELTGNNYSLSFSQNVAYESTL